MPQPDAEGRAIVTGTAEPGSTVTVTFPDGSTVSVTAAVPDGTFTATSADPQPSGTITVAATDVGGNTSSATTIAFVAEGTSPTVTLSTGTTSVTAGQSLTVTIAFSAPVTGFVSDDLTVSNASVSSLTGSGGSYTAVLMATGSGEVTVSIAANVAEDAAQNGNTASNILSVASRVIDETQELITSFMQGRANLLLRHQPGLIGFMSGNRRGDLTLSTRGTGGDFNFASPAGKPVWANLTGSWSTDDTANFDYVFGAIGAHRAFSDTLMAGAMVQFDHMEETDGDGRVRGTGWLAGPYFIARAASQPLFFEGRLLYGETRNKISPYGTYEDSFDTRRFLTQFKVAGEIERGATIWSPFVDVAYTTDDMAGYVDSLGNAIPDQKVSLGQIELGLDFSTLLEISRGELELWGGASAIWSQTGGEGFARSVTPSYEGGRARLKLGLNYTLRNGQSLFLSGWYDGIGAEDYESFGLNLGYEKTF